MSKLLVMYSSGTTTSRLKRLMEKENRNARVVQVPKYLSKHGCSFGLSIDEANLRRLLELSKEIDVKHRGIFIEKHTSEGQEYIPY